MFHTTRCHTGGGELKTSVLNVMLNRSQRSTLWAVRGRQAETATEDGGLVTWSKAAIKGLDGIVHARVVLVRGGHCVDEQVFYARHGI